jgi:hypothetical protein
LLTMLISIICWIVSVWCNHKSRNNYFQYLFRLFWGLKIGWDTSEVCPDSGGLKWVNTSAETMCSQECFFGGWKSAQVRQVRTGSGIFENFWTLNWTFGSVQWTLKATESDFRFGPGLVQVQQQFRIWPR